MMSADAYQGYRMRIDNLQYFLTHFAAGAMPARLP